MAKTIQIRRVPDRVLRTRKVRAARAGMSLSTYLRAELERPARQLTLEGFEQRLAKAEPVVLREPLAAAERAERGA